MNNYGLTQEEIHQMADNAIIWIEALKSGEYRKGAGQLGYCDKEGNWSYCCLGVACKVLNMGVDFNEPLSRDLVKKIGLQDEMGSYGGPIKKGFLSRENDQIYVLDEDFKNMVGLIMDNLDTLFIEPVGDLIMEHYNVKGH